MNEDDHKKFLELRHKELRIMDELKREPRVVDGALNFDEYQRLHAELREARAAMASLTWSAS